MSMDKPSTDFYDEEKLNQCFGLSQDDLHFFLCRTEPFITNGAMTICMKTQTIIILSMTKHSIPTLSMIVLNINTLS